MIDTEAIRERLLADRAQLTERLLRLDDQVHHREEPLPQDFAEQAVELENQEVLVALDDDARVEINQIDLALKRLENGSYGICTACQESIEPARLAALPMATTCIDCADAAEH